MKKYFICSDIHGYYYEWMKALKEAGFDINNNEHIIICCGDLIGKGSYQKKCLEFVCNLIDKNRIITIKGNHEDLINQALARNGFIQYNGNYLCKNDMILLNDLEYLDYNDDIIATMKKNKNWEKYNANLINYYETNNYVFTHSWIPCYINNFRTEATKFKPLEDWHKASNKQWEDARWINSYLAWEQNIKDTKTIISGHISTRYANLKFNNIDSFNTFIGDGIIGLDSSVYTSHFINILVLTEEEL